MVGEGGVPRGVREGRALLLAGVITTLGDALAGVAAGFLVNQRTGSASLTVLTLAASFLPGLFGGLGLSGLADRLPRREVVIVCLLLCVPVVLAILIPGMPALGVIGLVALIQLVSQPLVAARTALITQVVPPERLQKFIGLDRTAYQLCIFLGVILGAAGVGLLGATTALALDAATFALSALFIVLIVRSRPAPRSTTHVPLVGGARDGWRAIRQEPRALRAVLLAWGVVAGGIVLEGLVIPLARSYSGEGAESTATTNVVVLLLGSLTGVAVTGAFVGSWLSARSQRALMVPLGLSACLPAIAFTARPSLAVAVGLYALAGLCSVSSIFGQIMFSMSIRPDVFARAMGVAAGGVNFAQGMSLVATAALAEIFDVQDVIAICCGFLSILIVVAAVVTRLPPESRRDEVGRTPTDQGQRIEIVPAQKQAPVETGSHRTSRVPGL